MKLVIIEIHDWRFCGFLTLIYTSSKTRRNISWKEIQWVSKLRIYYLSWLTVFDVRMYIFVLPNAYSLADIGKSRSRHVTPSTDPSPLQWGHVWFDNILYRSKKPSYSSRKTYPCRRINVVSTSLKREEIDFDDILYFW